MKLTLIITLVLLMSSPSTPAQEPQKISAIEIFKQQDKVKALLAKHTDQQYSTTFGEVEMGSLCGFVGCQWQKLVSMVITSNRANAPSVTFLGVVEGWMPDRGVAPTVRFVELTDMSADRWNVQL